MKRYSFALFHFDIKTVYRLDNLKTFWTQMLAAGGRTETPATSDDAVGGQREPNVATPVARGSAAEAAAAADDDAEDVEADARPRNDDAGELGAECDMWRRGWCAAAGWFNSKARFT